MNGKYLIRLDDACPYMDKSKWQRMEDILDNYSIRPLVGVIPANADPQTKIDSEDTIFWKKVHLWEKKGWSIALHGYDHVCTTESGGLNPVHKRSEFAGLSYDEQCQKIKDGYTLLKDKGFDVKWFFAPSHTFDENTLKALKECTPIRYISDMIATKPYQYKGFTFVPCQMGVLREMPLSGFWTACYHPNIMDDRQFEMLETFLKDNYQDFITFSDLPLAHVGSKTIFDRMLSFCYFAMRRLKG